MFEIEKVVSKGDYLYAVSGKVRKFVEVIEDWLTLTSNVRNLETVDDQAVILPRAEAST